MALQSQLFEAKWRGLGPAEGMPTGNGARTDTGSQICFRVEGLADERWNVVHDVMQQWI